jgi:hypothetical protein
VKYASTETMLFEKDGTWYAVQVADCGKYAVRRWSCLCASYRLFEADCSPAGVGRTCAVRSDYLKIAGFHIDVTNAISLLLASAVAYSHSYWQYLNVNGARSFEISSDSAFWERNGGLRLNGKGCALLFGLDACSFLGSFFFAQSDQEMAASKDLA